MRLARGLDTADNCLLTLCAVPRREDSRTTWGFSIMAFDIGSAIAGGTATDYESSTGADKQEVTSNSLNVLRMLAEEQIAKEKEIADLEASVKTAKEELAVIQTKKLPEFMNEHDLPEF